MAKIDLPYEIINNTPANATPVQSDFTRIEQHINSELIERGGTVAMTAQLRLVGNPVNALDAAPKQYVDTIFPIGGIMMFGGVTAPPGGVWLMCDGSPYETAVYPLLFAVIGTRFGGSGGFFNVPPMVDRVPVGGGGTYAVGAQGGSADAIVPVHNHSIDHGHSGTSVVDLNHLHGIGGTTNLADRALGTSSNGDHAHNEQGGQGFVVTEPTSPSTYMAFSGAGLPVNTRPATAGGGGHTHAVTDHTHALPANTGWMDRSNTHSHSVPVTAGTSGTTGEALAGKNMPPYVGMAFLIRAA